MGFGESLLGAGINLLGAEGGGLAEGLLGGDSGGLLEGVVGGLLGGDGAGSLGGIGSTLLGDAAGGLLSDFAGSEGLKNVIGGVMQGDSIGDAVVGGLLGGGDMSEAVGGLLGNSGLANGVSDMLGGESNNWLGGMTNALAGSGGIVSTVAEVTGGNFSGVGGIADTLGEAVGGGLGNVISTAGAAASGDGKWFSALDNVIEGTGGSFGSPGGILGTVQELAGDGPAWLQTAGSVAGQLGGGSLSEVATSALGEVVGDSPGLQNIAGAVGDALGDAGLVGSALGELGDWGEMADHGLDALGVDLPDVGGAAAALTALAPEPIAGFGEDLLGAELLEAAHAPVALVAEVREAAPDVGATTFAEPNALDEFDAGFESDPGAPPDPDPTALIEEPAPMDDLTEAVEAADELESSLDDLFEGLE